MRVILVAAIVLLGAGVRPATAADFRCEAEDETLKFNLVTLRKKDKLGKPGYYLSVRDKAAPTEFSVNHFGPQEVSAFRYRISDASFNLTFTLKKPAGEPYGDVTLLIDAPKKETSSKRIDYKGKYSIAIFIPSSAEKEKRILFEAAGEVECASADYNLSSNEFGTRPSAHHHLPRPT
ncbi:MAG TPA: hypothetical protein VE423_06480 [Microvirga sp.]|nr:hypothetical protein [Microvirga sp.]